jgi:hypothetical protein
VGRVSVNHLQRKPKSNPSSTQKVIMEAIIILGGLFAVFCGLAGLILGTNNPN